MADVRNVPVKSRIFVVVTSVFDLVDFARSITIIRRGPLYAE